MYLFFIKPHYYLIVSETGFFELFYFKELFFNLHEMFMLLFGL